jgi:hypothetical protein
MVKNILLKKQKEMQKNILNFRRFNHLNLTTTKVDKNEGAKKETVIVI